MSFAGKNGLESLQVYEEETLQRIITLTRPGAAMEVTPVKVGPYRKSPLYIHSLPLTIRNRDLERADRVAHRLSSLPDREMHSVMRSLQRVVILPELVSTESQLLSHLYIPSHRTLVRYLYPERMEKRMDQTLPERLQGLPGQGGLEEAVLHSLLPLFEGWHMESRTRTHFQPIHKFTIPHELLTPLELEELDSLSMSCRMDPAFSRINATH